MALEKSLPSEYYLSEEIFGRERERIFSREWFCAGRADTLPPPGELRVLDLLGESILVARTREGKLVAHYNVCRHRGARLCTGDAATAAIRCPYHAWTYGLDGKLLGAPFLNQDPALRQEDFSLYPVGIQLWGGFFFLNLWPAGPVARNFPAALGAIPERLGRYPLDVARDGAEHLLRRRRELEGRRRELQRVLPLRRRPPGAVRGRPGLQGRRGSGARLGARHSAPRRRLHVHEERDHHARALRRPLGGGEGPAQGRARLSESLPLALARPRRGVSSDAGGPGPHARRLRLPLRSRRDGAARASTLPTPSTSGTSSTGRTGRSASRSSGGWARGCTSSGTTRRWRTRAWTSAATFSSGWERRLLLLDPRSDPFLQVPVERVAVQAHPRSIGTLSTPRSPRGAIRPRRAP